MIAGRRLGVQAVPRFDMCKLRPFEVMFADNKDYPCYVRGGYKTTFLFVDYKTRAKYKVGLRNKTENGSFQQGRFFLWHTQAGLPLSRLHRWLWFNDPC